MQVAATAPETNSFADATIGGIPTPISNDSSILHGALGVLKK